MKTIHFIVNPAAGKGKAAKYLHKLETAAKHENVPHEIYVTKKAGDAKDYANAHNEQGIVLVAVGGDGTMHEIINGLAEHEEILSIVSILPVGSGNDFARSIGFPPVCSDCFHTIINHENIIPIDIGKIVFKQSENLELVTHYFTSSCGIGFDAYAANLSNKNTVLRGLPLYLSSVIRTIFSYKCSTAKIFIDDNLIEKKQLLVAVGNGKTAGGGFRLTPQASITDGLLDLCAIEELSKFKILRKLPLAIKGEHLGLKEVFYKQFKNIRLEFSPGTYIHSDGELLSQSVCEIEISVEAQRVQAIVGKIC